MAAPGAAAALFAVWFFSVGPGAQDTPSPLMLVKPLYEESKNQGGFRAFLRNRQSKKDETNPFSKSIDELELSSVAAASLAVLEYSLDLLPQPMMREFTETYEDLKFLGYLLR